MVNTVKGLKKLSFPCVQVHWNFFSAIMLIPRTLIEVTKFNTQPLIMIEIYIKILNNENQQNFAILTTSYRSSDDSKINYPKDITK